MAAFNRDVPRLATTPETKKFAPRQANDEASRETSPVRATPGQPSRSSATPRNGASTPRFSGHSPRSVTSSPSGGTTLYVNGMGTHARQRSEGGSYMFRSTTSIADAHIKDTSMRIVPGPYTPARTSLNANTSSSFRSKSPSDRDAHMRDLMNGTYGSPRAPTTPSPSRSQLLPSASFRSASPTACAHIQALPKPVDAQYDYNGRRIDRGLQPSASFRSTTSIADAHIKASPGMHEVAAAPSTPRSGAVAAGCTSSFRSTTSIGDAHIRALPKPVDVVVAYRD